MDTIEEGLKRIDEHNISAINKHKELFSKAISESASISNKCSKNLDTEFSKIFPEVNSLNNTKTSIFNPITVVEFRNNQAYQIIDTWDKDYGLLPERKSMGTYHVDIGIYIKSLYCTAHNMEINNMLNGKYNCSCPIHNTTAFIGYKPSTPDLFRPAENYTRSFHSKTTYTFQVDNYLNLYHIESGLYLMFNKTSFPYTPFHLKKNDFSHIIVYKSKQLEKLNNPNLFDKEYHSSIDTRSTFLNDINYIIPENILKSYDFFNRFRKFKNFTLDNTNMDLFISTPETSTDDDPRDKLIESYKQRLETTTKRADNAEKIMQTMLEEYEQKTVDIKTINFELQQHKLELLEKQSQYKKDLLENETKQILSYVNTIEDLKNNNFRLNQQLLEIETYKSKTDTMGLSIETLKKENAITLLSLEKQKALTDKLITQLKTEKTKNDVIIQQNTEYKNNYMSLETNYTFIKNDLLKLEEQIKDKTLECRKMSDTLKQLGNTSSDALENALSDKLETLNTTNTLLKEENSKLNIEYNKVSKQLEKLQSTLKNMLE